MTKKEKKKLLEEYGGPEKQRAALRQMKDALANYMEGDKCICEEAELEKGQCLFCNACDAIAEVCRHF